MKDYVETGKVRIVFKDFPLDFHPHAQKAAESARCVREQLGIPGYWKMHDALFAHQADLGVENYKLWAREFTGLNGPLFDTCLDSGRYAKDVQADLAYGKTLGVQGTPGFFINGLELSGAQPYTAFKQVIDQELAA